MSLSVPVGSTVTAALEARDVFGSLRTGLTAADFSISLQQAATSAGPFSAVPDTVTMRELDSAALPGIYEFSFKPSLAGVYVLRVRPTFSDAIDEPLVREYETTSAASSGPASTFCSTAQVKAYIGDMSSASDTVLDDLTRQVTRLIQRMTGADIFATDRVVKADGHGASELVLPERPIISISAVYESREIPRVYDATTQLSDGEDFFRDDEAAILYRRPGDVWASGPQAVRVDYRSGFETVPDDVQLAAIRLCATIFLQRKRLGMSSQSGADMSTAYYDHRAMPIDVADVIDRYRSGMAF